MVERRAKHAAERSRSEVRLETAALAARLRMICEPLGASGASLWVLLLRCENALPMFDRLVRNLLSELLGDVLLRWTMLLPLVQHLPGETGEL